MKYEVKNMNADEANTYFAGIRNDDATIAVDLDADEVTTLGALARSYPRSDHSDKHYLILPHATMQKAQQWWEKREKLEHEGKSYTLLDDQPDNILGINHADKQAYKLVWDEDLQMLVPSLTPDEPGNDTPDPRYDVNTPVGVMPME